MALFGQNPSQGTLLKGSQFLAGEHASMLPESNTAEQFPEELPVRLAHRVKELDELPHNLSGMPSITKVKHWYAQSFEVRSLSMPLLRRSNFILIAVATGTHYIP
jgi:pyruvate dehydrogenase kinase 2/3/4